MGDSGGYLVARRKVPGRGERCACPCCFQKLREKTSAWFSVTPVVVVTTLRLSPQVAKRRGALEGALLYCPNEEGAGVGGSVGVLSGDGGGNGVHRGSPGPAWGGGWAGLTWS